MMELPACSTMQGIVCGLTDGTLEWSLGALSQQRGWFEPVEAFGGWACSRTESARHQSGPRTHRQVGSENT